MSRKSYLMKKAEVCPLDKEERWELENLIREGE